MKTTKLIKLFSVMAILSPIALGALTPNAFANERVRLNQDQPPMLVPFVQDNTRVDRSVVFIKKKLDLSADIDMPASELKFATAKQDNTRVAKPLLRANTHTDKIMVPIKVTEKKKDDAEKNMTFEGYITDEDGNKIPSFRSKEIVVTAKRLPEQKDAQEKDMTFEGYITDEDGNKIPSVRSKEIVVTAKRLPAVVEIAQEDLDKMNAEIDAQMEKGLNEEIQKDIDTGLAKITEEVTVKKEAKEDKKTKENKVILPEIAQEDLDAIQAQIDADMEAQLQKELKEDLDAGFAKITEEVKVKKEVKEDKKTKENKVILPEIAQEDLDSIQAQIDADMEAQLQEEITKDIERTLAEIVEEAKLKKEKEENITLPQISQDDLNAIQAQIDAEMQKQLDKEINADLDSIVDQIVQESLAAKKELSEKAAAEEAATEEEVAIEESSDDSSDELAQLEEENAQLETVICEQEDKIASLEKTVEQLQAQTIGPYNQMMQMMQMMMMMNQQQTMLTPSYSPLDLMGQMMAPIMQMQAFQTGLITNSMLDRLSYRQYTPNMPMSSTVYNIGRDYMGTYSNTANPTTTYQNPMPSAYMPTPFPFESGIYTQPSESEPVINRTPAESGTPVPAADTEGASKLDENLA